MDNQPTEEQKLLQQYGNEANVAWQLVYSAAKPLLQIWEATHRVLQTDRKIQELRLKKAMQPKLEVNNVPQKEPAA